MKTHCNRQELRRKRSLASTLAATLTIISASFNTTFAQTIYFCSDMHIFRGSADGEAIEVIYPKAQNAARLPVILCIALDLTAEKIYWIEGSYPFILRANLDGSVVENFIRISEPQLLEAELAVDSDKGWVYWKSKRDDAIQRVHTDGRGLEELPRHLNGGTGIHADSAGGKFYWCDWCAVRRSDFDGTNYETIALRDDSHRSSPVVSTKHDRVYWLTQRDNSKDLLIESMKIPTYPFVWSEESLDLVATIKSMWMGAMTIDEVNERLYCVGQSNLARVTGKSAGPCIQTTDLELKDIETIFFAIGPGLGPVWNGRFSRSDFCSVAIDPRTKSLRNGLSTAVLMLLPATAVLAFTLYSVVRRKRRLARKMLNPSDYQIHRRQRLVLLGRVIAGALLIVVVAWVLSSQFLFGYHGYSGRISSSSGVIRCNLPQTPWPLGRSEFLIDIRSTDPLPVGVLGQKNSTIWDAFVAAPSFLLGAPMIGLEPPEIDILPAGEGMYYYRELRLTIPYWLLFLILCVMWHLVGRRRGRVLVHNECAVCHYDLTGNISGICPECGAKVNSEHVALD